MKNPALCGGRRLAEGSRWRARATGLSRCTLYPVLPLAIAACGCGPNSTHPPARHAAVDHEPAREYSLEENEFSVMSFNLHRYALDDRDGDGQRDDPKPEEEREALIRLIAEAGPDVLAVQEMGDPTMLADFKSALSDANLTYGFEEYLRRKPHEMLGEQQVHLAVLSRLPIVSRQSHTSDSYTIGESRDLPVARGFIDVDIRVHPDYSFRLMVAHLKSKVYHPLGQTAMRRNEARLLNNHVRAALRDAPDLNLLVVGDLNDTPRSRAIREVLGIARPYLFDLRPIDRVGDAWTHFRAGHDTYSRLDYGLVSAGLRPEVVHTKTRVVRNPLTYRASDHRPLMLVFEARDRPLAEPAP